MYSTYIYDRVSEISINLGDNIYHQYMTTEAVCPPKLKCRLFTTAAADNLILIITSTSAHD